jgi:imidazolonepropionase-like amidohydrolase
MRRGWFVVMNVVAAACAGRRPASEMESRASTIAIVHVAVADATGSVARTDQTVVVRDGVISAVGEADQVVLPTGAQIVDGRGKFLIPGLWDMHVHLGLEGHDAPGQYIAHGVTTVRDMGTQFEQIDRLRQEIATGQRIGPRIYAAGPMIENRGAMRYILDHVTAEDSARARRDRLELSTPDEATRAVDSLAGLGVDLIKARDFADAATYWAIAGAARRARLPFVAHPPPGQLHIDPIALADSGQRSVEHWFYPDDLWTLAPAARDSIIAAYVRRGTAFDPTMVTWRQHRFTADTVRGLLDAAIRDPRAAAVPALVRQWQKDLADRMVERDGRPATKAQLAGWNRVLDQYARRMKQLADAGVIVLAGSDLPFARFSGDGLHDELAALVSEGGFTPQQALAAATTSPARFFGLQDSVGTVAPGKRADLVLLDADPMTDIANVRRTDRVMQAGRWLWRRH